MTNICRCGTYQRIRAAVHMAAGMKVAAAARQRAEGRDAGRSLMKIDHDSEVAESVAPQVHRRLRRVAGGGLALGLPLPFGIDVAAGRAEAASRAATSRGQRVGRRSSPTTPA